MAAFVSRPMPSDLPCHAKGFRPEINKDHQVQITAQHWLTQLELASTSHNGDAFASLFIENGFWRDILAFTNDYRAIRTANIAAAAKARFPIVKAHDFVFTQTTPSLQHPFEDVTFLSLHFGFKTAIGPAYGVANLVWDTDAWRAFTVFTLLEGIHGHEPKIGAARDRGSHNDELSYDERRTREREFTEADPAVLIIGGGHNGLATAAQLKALGVETLVIDTYKRVGDNWRLRYKSLSLHDPVHANHLPFIPFPPNWPLYTPAGKLANFLESYVDVLELNVWCQAVINPNGTSFNDNTGKWDVSIERTLEDGSKESRHVTVGHIILATGLGGGKPKMPAPFPGQASWDGRAVHSSGHDTGAKWAGKKALVVGACTSAHDIAVDFAKHGVNVTMLQRSPTYVMSVDNGQAMMVGGLYGEDTPSTDIADRIGECNPKLVAKLFHKRLIPRLAEQDAELLNGLSKAGFNWWLGPEDCGFLPMALEKAGGYYFSTGGSEMIARGDIKMRQGEITSFEPEHTVAFKDGSSDKFDIVVFATGYTGFPDTVRATLGEQYATTFNPVWGLDEEGEIRGVCRESGIPNAFFIVGNLSACRVSSKVLALQVLAQQLGVFGERYTWAKQKADEELSDQKHFEIVNGMKDHPEVVRDDP